jgi:pyruvate,water dikinase
MTVAPLDQRLDPARFGGKAAQLAAAARAGLPVPAGVALSVALVNAVARGDPSAAGEIERAASSLHPPLAVRSSAVGEDSDDTSFAGQHLTCLNVRSAAEAAAAVREIRHSAHDEAALAYRVRIGIGIDEPPRVGVLLQELVDADCAGVLFTRNPLDGADELVVEAAWGLGEGVVAGLVTPDRFRVRRDGTVLERVAGLKDVAVVRSPEGGTREAAIEEKRARTLCLTDRQLAELAQLGQRCEHVFGGARDIEWAYARGTLHLLQCRAITRTAPAPC